MFFLTDASVSQQEIRRVKLRGSLDFPSALHAGVLNNVRNASHHLH